MTAFLDLLNNFAIWIYIICVIGILFGIKMLFDARRAAKTTLFTLEQEQAGDRAFRAILVMGVCAVVIGGVASVNSFISPAIPTPIPVFQPTSIPFTPPVILPSATPTVTHTPIPPTATPTVPPTAAPQPAVSPTPPVQATTPPVEPTPEAPPPTPTSERVYPAPPLNAPQPNDSIGRNYIQFMWGRNADGGLDVPEKLPPDQWYRVSISYTERTSNEPKLLLKCLHESSVDTRSWGTVLDSRGNAVDSSYTWSVIVIQAADQGTCETGGGSPISPPSEQRKFILP